MATLYLNEQQSIVKKRDGYLIVQYPPPDKRKIEVPLIKVTQVVISGDITLTTPAVHTLLEAGIEICYLSMYGHFRGRLSPPVAKNLLLRSNRQLQDSEVADATATIQRIIREIPRASTVGSLLGYEGNGSAAYFGVFGKLLRDPMTFSRRRRRPPKDPVNALLSLGYTLLLHQVSSAIQVVGFDPYAGYLHQPRYGRPALALDLMEEFRPIIADSVVLNIINHRILTEQDFQEELGVVHLKAEARKKFYAKFEERLQEELQHPHFEYRTSYRRCIELQARLLGKWLTGEIPVYLPLSVR